MTVLNTLLQHFHIAKLNGIRHQLSAKFGNSMEKAIDEYTLVFYF